ncbi:MAG: DUF4326 domain-containing protein [Steroidobacteraceae bacterium]
MPPNTVKVDRTTKWGNPFVVGKPGGAFTAKVMDRRHAYLLYKSVALDNEQLIAAARAELRGKNLACWCQNDNPWVRSRARFHLHADRIIRQWIGLTFRA